MNCIEKLSYINTFIVYILISKKKKKPSVVFDLFGYKVAPLFCPNQRDVPRHV